MRLLQVYQNSRNALVLFRLSPVSALFSECHEWSAAPLSTCTAGRATAFAVNVAVVQVNDCTARELFARTHQSTSSTRLDRPQTPFFKSSAWHAGNRTRRKVLVARPRPTVPIRGFWNSFSMLNLTIYSSPGVARGNSFSFRCLAWSWSAWYHFLFASHAQSSDGSSSGIFWTYSGSLQVQHGHSVFRKYDMQL